MRLVYGVHDRLKGTPAGSQGQLQYNFGARGRWYLHRIVAWERHRLVHGHYPAAGMLAHHRDFNEKHSFYDNLRVVTLAEHNRIHVNHELVA